MIADIFRDVLKHTFNTGHIELVKLTGEDKHIAVEALEEGHTIILNGVIPHTIEKLDGVVGLSRMQILKGFLGHEGFSQDGAKVSVATQQKGEYAVPAELHFSSSGGSVAGTYRFMSTEVANKQICLPTFKGATWDVEINPTIPSMKEFISMNSILGPYEERFTVKTVEQRLEFYLGSAASSQAKIVFARNITGSLQHAWEWPLSQVMSLLKLHDTSKDFKMAFSSAGVLKITVDSGIGLYEYMLPAAARP